MFIVHQSGESVIRPRGGGNGLYHHPHRGQTGFYHLTWKSLMEGWKLIRCRREDGGETAAHAGKNLLRVKHFSILLSSLDGVFKTFCLGENLSDSLNVNLCFFILLFLDFFRKKLTNDERKERFLYLFLLFGSLCNQLDASTSPCWSN